MLSGSEIRKKFLDFFAEKGHLVHPSSSLVPPEESGLLWTSAGVVQFMPYMEGKSDPPESRLVSVQKCMRTTDIENVGFTARHLTFFEMLGNFSVGDYFKKEAISWAWEFLLEELGLSVDDLWVSVFHEDDQAFEIWRDDIGLSADKIVRLGKEDNFWEVGIGPCGPCSEIFFDWGEDAGCGDDCRPGCDCDRYSEIWNLVFTQYNRTGDGNYEPLPDRNIDTGMGLERIACVMQNKRDVFQSDLFAPILKSIAGLVGKSPENPGRALKVMADHMRAITFAIGDGVLPSNEGRGYVIRRLLRRAVRYGHAVGVQEPFLHRGVETIVEEMGDIYPDLDGQTEHIARVVKQEEERFHSTLEQGLTILGEVISDLTRREQDTIPGEQIFRLYDTYGFPPELTEEIASEEELAIDMEGFEREMEKQRERARRARDDKDGDVEEIHYRRLREKEGISSRFIGYEKSSCLAEVKAILSEEGPVEITGEDDTQQRLGIVIDQTPFYAEAGGQVGDTGLLENETAEFRVDDTRKPVDGLIVHMGTIESGTIEVGDHIQARIDGKRRQNIACNHTATHLIHQALREVLGEHVAQSGSLVDRDHLRFDFTHMEPLSREEIEQVEDLVNEQVWADHVVEVELTNFQKASKKGALALFEEQYDEEVRLVKIGDFSLELCGGTHLGRTGQLGLVKITEETGVAAGVRRLEAVTGSRALAWVRERSKILRELSERLNTPPGGLVKRVEALEEELKEAREEVRSLRMRLGSSRVDELLQESYEVEGIKMIAARVEGLDNEALRSLGDKLLDRLESGLVVLGSSQDERALFVAMATDDAVERGINAGDLLGQVARITGGGGGGRPGMAQAGGNDPSRLDEALAISSDIVREMVSG